MKVTILASFHCTYEYAFECVRSIAAQHYSEYEQDLTAIILDDASPDDSWRPKYEAMAKRIGVTMMRSDVREGQASSRLKLIKKYLEMNPRPREDEIVVFFDGDDRFLGKYDIQTIVDRFFSETLFVFGKMEGWPQRRYEDNFSADTVRTLPWACTPPRSMRANVLRSVELQESMFKVDGEWLESATDQALMYELIERSGATREQVSYTDKDVMWYRIHPGGNLGSNEKQGRALKNEQIVRQRMTDYYTKS
jgi:glycosyltransferase involved in cell wall biosynthesis